MVYDTAGETRLAVPGRATASGGGRQACTRSPRGKVHTQPCWAGPSLGSLGSRNQGQGGQDPARPKSTSCATGARAECRLLQIANRAKNERQQDAPHHSEQGGMGCSSRVLEDQSQRRNASFRTPAKSQHYSRRNLGEKQG